MFSRTLITQVHHGLQYCLKELPYTGGFIVGDVELEIVHCYGAPYHSAEPRFVCAVELEVKLRPAAHLLLLSIYGDGI